MRPVVVTREICTLSVPEDWILVENGGEPRSNSET